MDHAPISYGELLRLPNVRALLAATCLSRLAGRMFGIAIVFHALAAFGSPGLAGWIGFAAMAPGLLVSPLAGAFLDRAGAVRGIVVDLAVSAAVALTLALCILGGRAGPLALLALAAAYALTSPLSAAGIRVLLPRLVPGRVLDRANALDTAIHGIVGVIGPSLAGVLIGFANPAIVFALIGACYGGATICVARIRATPSPTPGARRFLVQALAGLLEVLRRPLLRGLAVGYALNNFTWGILVVAVPVYVAQGFGAGTWETVSGVLWAGMGLAGGIGALAAGQLGMHGREVRIMTLCLVVTGLALAPAAAGYGVLRLAFGMAMTGLLAGPIDVGVLTLRQRRTDPALLGRVLAVSMSLNMSGFPIGAALGGMLVAWSPSAAFLGAALASLLAAWAVHGLIPNDAAPARAGHG